MVSSLTTILLIVFVVAVLGITAWAIGWLVTGKSRSIRRDGCCHSVKKDSCCGSGQCDDKTPEGKE